MADAEDRNTAVFTLIFEVGDPPPPPRRFTVPRFLIATTVASVAVPLVAAAWIDARTTDLADHLGATAGLPVRIGSADAALTGVIRISDVVLGDLFRADAIEASVALDSLLSGTLRADEIEVESPRVALEIDADGDSNLARVAHRFAHAGGSGGSARPRRIVVTSGALEARIAGIGELSADDVELVPDADKIRLVTGSLRVHSAPGTPAAVDLTFARSAADMTLPHVRFGRFLAVGGTGTLALGGGPPVALRDAAAGRLVSTGAVALRTSIDDHGVARPLAIDVEASSHGLAVALRGDHVPLAGLGALVPHGLELATAHATGTLVARTGAERIGVELDGSIQGLVIDHRAVAEAAVPIAADVRGSLAITPDAIAFSHLATDIGAAHWTAAGWIRRGAPLSAQLDVGLAAAPCNDLFAALPTALRGPLDGIVLDGVLGGRMRLAIDLAAPAGDGVTLASSVTGNCRVLAAPPAADVTRLARHDEKKHTAPWIDLRKVPYHVAGAFISAEDARFYDHDGFDLVQIGKSLEIDLREHKLARGGSTISQQLVKNAFLSQRRSLDRKIQEALLTWQLEAALDKKQILERYLNIIELGPRVFGITAAAKFWFGVTPSDLTIPQAAFLAALNAEPVSMTRRIRKAGKLDKDSVARVDVILHAMRRDGLIDADQLEASRTATIHFVASALAD